MTKLKNTLTLGVVVVAAIGAGASFYVVHSISADAARALLAVQAGTVAALGIVVAVLMSATVKRIDELVEALRALARGERHARVDAAHFAGLADVARGVNEVAASLCENDDPNLGPVQKRTRERAVFETPEPRKSKSDPPAPRAPRTERVERPPLGPSVPREAAPGLSDHPEIGEVRVRKKAPPKPSSTPPAPTPPAPTPEPATVLAPPAETPAPASTPPATSTAPASTSTTAQTPAPSMAAPSMTTSDISPAPDGNDTVIEPAAEPDVPQFPSAMELQALFAEFVKEKKAAGDDVDLDYAAFEETILSECERLLAEHGCRGVRFEVALGDGDVSLRPRLLR